MYYCTITFLNFRKSFFASVFTFSLCFKKSEAKFRRAVMIIKNYYC